METLESTTEPPPPPATAPLAPSTLAQQADSHLNRTPDVAPPIHVSTTFRHASEPTALIPASSQPHPHPPDAHIYSRHTAPTSTRLETLLAPLLHGPCLTYASGLAALHALYVFLHPARVSIGAGYHGSQGVLALHSKLHNLQILPLDCAPEELHVGDVIHLETPVNPSGEARHIAAYAEKAHSRGAYLVVDATFGPPGLQEPFQWGADVVMHSGTKYLGGHSDLLMGVLAVAEGRREWIGGLKAERVFLGSVMGGLEGWLGVRSLRTLELRVRRQSASAGRLVGWLAGCVAGGEGGEEGKVVRRVVERVQHASLQEGDMAWLRRQMPVGFGPVFAIWMRDGGLARRLPSCLELFAHATSLGGVESLVEWRAMTDESVDHRVLRVSVGLEDWEDLRRDLLSGFERLAEEDKGGEDYCL
jgi:cystathionine gamma-synthase